MFVCNILFLFYSRSKYRSFLYFFFFFLQKKGIDLGMINHNKNFVKIRQFRLHLSRVKNYSENDFQEMDIPTKQTSFLSKRGKILFSG